MGRLSGLQPGTLWIWTHVWRVFPRYSGTVDEPDSGDRVDLSTVREGLGTSSRRVHLCPRGEPMSRCVDCNRLIVDQTSHFFGTVGPLCVEHFELRRKRESAVPSGWLGFLLRLFGGR
jgi:hypothetical protein